MKTQRLLAPLLAFTCLLGGAGPAPAPDEPPQFVLVGAGRFAVLADMASIHRAEGLVRMRALQVGEADLEIAGQRYWGGWSWWSFDCRGKTADRLDFASVREGGAEGPATPDSAPPYEAAPGGDAAELLAAACDPASSGPPVARSVAEAVVVGRAALTAED